jgi:hypothetical protein
MRCFTLTSEQLPSLTGPDLARMTQVRVHKVEIIEVFGLEFQGLPSLRTLVIVYEDPRIATRDLDSERRRHRFLGWILS